MRIEAKDKALLAANAALDKHAEDVVVIDLRRLSSVSDFFVIATATSHRQAQAIVEQIEQELRHVGQRVWHVEGAAFARHSSAPPAGTGCVWILMDCGDVVVHLFDSPARNFYQLERLWGDAPRVSLKPEHSRR